MSQRKSPLTLAVVRLSLQGIWTFSALQHTTLQYYLSFLVKAGQELPCRVQAAHPQCGTSLGISAHMLTLPFPTRLQTW